MKKLIDQILKKKSFLCVGLDFVEYNYGMLIVVLWADGEREPVYANNVEVVNESR